MTTQVKDAIELRGIILNHMDVELEWTRETNFLGEAVFTSRDDEYQLTVARGNAESYWSLGQFTDSDVDGVAVGRYRSFAEGDNFDELLEALAAKPCEYCKRATVSPVFVVKCGMHFTAFHYYYGEVSTNSASQNTATRFESREAAQKAIDGLTRWQNPKGRSVHSRCAQCLTKGELD